MLKAKIAVFVSGGGTNLQAIIDSEKRGELQHCELSLVVSSKPGAYATVRAKENNIPFVEINIKDFQDRKDFENEVLKKLHEYNIDIIVFAGFMYILSAEFVSEYENRIINVHPALIPSFCGDGFYGLKVHKAVLDYGVKITGATVHYVNSITDGGKIILQKAIEVHDNDTPVSLQQRVMCEAEWVILPQACELVAQQIIESRNNIK
ncbi:MAG: phosphoribosylglycinamide formyltransferase [Clostridiales bacterium GWF2_38_85]|nr:MAG: phosphoribosylglycinamide formyltransferase [Clostridiales bacterium GWF2_38_85]